MTTSKATVFTQESFETNSLKDLSQESSKISSEQQVEYSETSSLLSDCKHELKDDDSFAVVDKHELKDDDSFAVEDKLEDESYPISDKIDSDFYDIKGREGTTSTTTNNYQFAKDDSFEFDTIKDKKDIIVDIRATKKDDFSIYKTKEREDILDLDYNDSIKTTATEDPDEILEAADSDADADDDNEVKRKTSFYIGESSIDIITKSADQKSDSEETNEQIYDDEMHDEFVHDIPVTENASVIYSPIVPNKSVYQCEQSISIQDDSIVTSIAKQTTTDQLWQADENRQLSTAQLSDSKLKLGLKLEKNETEEYTKFLSDSEDLVGTLSDYPVAQKANIVHSPNKPIQSSIKSETMINLQADSITTSSAQQITEIQSTIQSELDKINKSFAIDQNFIDQTIIEQTFAEVQESLKAVNEDLIEVVKDGRQIKESPSEFEFKVLPNIKYPQLEAHEEEFAQHHQHQQQQQQFSPEKQIETIDPERSISPSKDGEQSSNDDSINKLDVIHRQSKGHTKQTNRWSVSDPDNYSSSGSHYESFEKTDSRPCSSDVENLFTSYGGNSSEYQTAHDASLMPGSTTEYQTAANTLNDYSGHTISSHESMKSFDSESSGHLGSVEVSEASETLVPSTMDIDLPSDSPQDFDIDENEMKLSSLEACSGILLESCEDDSELIISPSMKRSQEMMFDPYRGSSIDEKIITVTEKSISSEEHKYGSLEESRLGTSLEDGSILSQSLSSTSNVETVVDNFKDEMASSYGSSLIGSYEMQSLLRDDMTGTSFDEQQGGRIDNMVMTTSVVKEDDVHSVNTQITTTIASNEIKPEFSETIEQQPTAGKRTKGHKRNDSTSFLKGLEAAKQSIVDISLDEEMIDHEQLKRERLPSEELDDLRSSTSGGGGDGGGGGGGSGAGSESDSDYDRYETEYARSFKQPTKQGKKKSLVEKAVEKVDMEKMERKISIPTIETIVEDEMAEVEQESTLERAVSQNMLDYSNIPDIMITDDPIKYVQDDDDDENAAVAATVDDEDDVLQEEMDIPERQGPARDVSSPIQYARESEIRITEEEYQDMIDKQYKSKIADITTKYDFEDDDNKGDSPTSDSFEMLEQPDIADEFVIIEEVAKEADEFDTEGKSVTIQNLKYVKKHDEEVETMLVRSAPAATNEGSIIYQGHSDLGFDFEDSPPTGVHESTGVSTYDPNGLDNSRKWVEMQLAEQAQNLRYPYDMERGVLEDIKEEDTDMEVGSSRISSFKDSFSSTPEYDVLAGRKYFAKEHDDMSVNSLQEFESLEQAISLENRKFQHGSQDSLSNGSFTKRYVVKAGQGQGDDISLSSLKEFEGLENACIEAHLIEIKAKEEAALLLSRSDESSNSDKALKSSPKMTTVTTMKTTIVNKSGPAADERQSVTMTTTTTTGSAGFHITKDDIDDNLMEVSSDSLDNIAKIKPSQSKDTSQFGSTDSLELNKSGANDIMTSSIDSMDIATSRGGSGTGKSSRSDADSLEQLLIAGRSDIDRHDSIDSIEMQYALMAQAQAGNYAYDRDSIDGNTKIDVQTMITTSGNQTIQTQTITTTSSSSTTTYGDGMTKDISNDSLNINQSEPELLLTSTESLDRSSSTATNATYQNATDSQMSGSITSCGSNTLIDTLDSQYDMYQYQGASSSYEPYQQPFTSAESTSAGCSSTTVTTTTIVNKTQAIDDEKTYDYYDQFNNKKGRVYLRHLLLYNTVVLLLF